MSQDYRSLNLRDRLAALPESGLSLENMAQALLYECPGKHPKIKSLDAELMDVQQAFMRVSTVEGPGVARKRFGEGFSAYIGIMQDALRVLVAKGPQALNAADKQALARGQQLFQGMGLHYKAEERKASALLSKIRDSLDNSGHQDFVPDQSDVPKTEDVRFESDKRAFAKAQDEYSRNRHLQHFARDAAKALSVINRQLGIQELPIREIG